MRGFFLTRSRYLKIINGAVTLWPLVSVWAVSDFEFLKIIADSLWSMWMHRGEIYAGGIFSHEKEHHNVVFSHRTSSGQVGF